jgi:hypothetical protein
MKIADQATVTTPNGVKGIAHDEEKGTRAEGQTCRSAPTGRPDGATDFGAFLDSELLGRLAADFAFHVEGAVREHLVRDVDPRHTSLSPRNGAFAPFVRPTPQSDSWRHDRGRIVS